MTGILCLVFLTILRPEMSFGSNDTTALQEEISSLRKDMNYLKEEYTRSLKNKDSRIQALEKAVFRISNASIELKQSNRTNQLEMEMIQYQMEDFAKR